MRAIDMKGVVLTTFGTGNVSNEVSSALKVFTERIIIINVSQCKKGCVRTSYAPGKVLLSNICEIRLNLKGLDHHLS